MLVVTSHAQCQAHHPDLETPAEVVVTAKTHRTCNPQGDPEQKSRPVQRWIARFFWRRPVQNCQGPSANASVPPENVQQQPAASRPVGIERRRVIMPKVEKNVLDDKADRQGENLRPRPVW